MSVGIRGRLFTLGAVFATVLGAVLLCAATAHAQDKPVDPKVAAKEHYAKGTSFYDLGRYDEAAKEFEAAYQLKNDPAFLYNLAQSYRQAGNHERAVHFYKTYLRYVPNAKNRADIEDKIKAEEKLVGSGGPGTTPPPVTTTPPPGNPPPPGYAPPATATASDPGRKFRIAGMATAGVGAVFTVLGIVEWRRAVKASSDIEDAAVSGMSFDPAVEDRGKSAETLQWVFYSVGALAVAGGVGLYFYGQRVTAAETTTWRVSLAPNLAPGQGGATLRISF